MIQHKQKIRLARLPIIVPLLTISVTQVYAAPEAEPNNSPASSPSLVDQEAAPSTSNNEPLEHQIAERLQLSLVGGEIVWLENSTEKFLGIYRPADEQPPQGAIVITSPPGTVVDSLSLLRILAESSARSG